MNEKNTKKKLKNKICSKLKVQGNLIILLMMSEDKRERLVQCLLGLPQPRPRPSPIITIRQG